MVVGSVSSKVHVAVPPCRRHQQWVDGSEVGTTVVNGTAAVKETAAIKETATMKGTAAMEEAAVLDGRTPVCDCHCLRIEHHFRNRTEYSIT